MTIEGINRYMSPVGCLLFGLVVGLGLVLTSPSVGWAHKVYIYAWVDGDTIYTESYFGAKKKVKGGVIQVFDMPGKKFLEGKTNDHGEFKFRVPERTDLRIVVEAGMGHRGEYILKAEEFSDVPAVEAEPPKAHGEEEAPLPPSQADAEKIRVLMEQTLDSRLTPIKRELAAIRNEKSPGLTEIIGGIGYVFGLMGLIMYLKSRKKDD